MGCFKAESMGMPADAAGSDFAYGAEAHLILYKCVVGRDCLNRIFEEDPPTPPECCGQPMKKIQI